MPEQWSYKLQFKFNFPSGVKTTGSSVFELMTDSPLKIQDKNVLQSVFDIVSEEQIE